MAGSGIRDQNIHRQATFPRKHLTVALITAISQTGVVAFKHTPGHRFQIVSVKTYCLTKAGTVTGNLKVGGRTSAALTFTSATENTPSLSAVKANNRGTATEAITVEYTTDGSGVLTNGFVVITYRVWPLNGEMGPGA